MHSGNAFQTTSEMLDLAFEEMPCAAMLYDHARTVRSVNRAARELLAAGGDWAGKQCSDAFGCPSCDPSCGLLAALRYGAGTTAGSIRYRPAGGAEILVSIKTSPVASVDHHAYGAVAVLTGVVAKGKTLIAESASMRQVAAFARRVAASEAATILIEGENGTGKDVIARVLHDASSRASGPFVSVNCAAMPETLLESELFGYEKGAFTDARGQKKGLMEMANNGTLFLDEIGELPLKLQAKLLRVIEDQRFRRLGGLADLHLDVRIVAATNRNLREAIRQGEFRQDLYYRLNVIQIWLPALRERSADILPLARHFVSMYSRKFGREIKGLTPAAEVALLGHHWPGNVRELRNAIERAMILEDGEEISVANLPLAVLDSTAPRKGAGAPDGEIVPLESAERALLERAMDRSGGNQTHAARLLGISRDTLRYRLKKFGLIERGQGGDGEPEADAMTVCA